MKYKEIIAINTLYLAHRKARLCKRHKKDVINFELNLLENLCDLHQALVNGTYDITSYHEFTITDPKERLIQATAYGDRVVQHSLCDNFLTPYVARHMIADNSACQIGKGTHYALRRVEQHLHSFYKQHGNSGFILKVDITKYFPSINHTVLKELVRKQYFEPELENLLCKIIDSYNREENIGLPMGNQTSQQFAIWYLDRLDRLIKEKLKIKYYNRYMDDMILIHENREYLKQVLEQMRMLVETELKLSFNNKTQIMPIHQGFDYLGWHFWLTETGKVVKKLRPASRKRIRKRINELHWLQK